MNRNDLPEIVANPHADAPWLNEYAPKFHGMYVGHGIEYAPCCSTCSQGSYLDEWDDERRELATVQAIYWNKPAGWTPPPKTYPTRLAVESRERWESDPRYEAHMAAYEAWAKTV